MAQTRLGIPALLTLLIVLTACTAAVDRGRPTDTIKRPRGMVALATPTLSQQVLRADQVGPGFLEYCPMRAGKAPARFELTLVGSPIVPGWCGTSARRGPHADTVTFRAHWDATGVNGESGTVTFVYHMDRLVTAVATPLPRLIRQSGPLPP